MPDKPYPGWKCVIPLPPRNDTEALSKGAWELPLPKGLDFEGQHFLVPEACHVQAETRWLEASLLAVSISIDAEAFVPCSRCLKQTSLAISDVLRYLYYSRGLEIGKDTSLESDEGFMPVEADLLGHSLDIAPQVWESLLLLLPMRVLCRSDCAGLCPRCGADLNEGPCGCTGEEGDPRFEVLRLFSVDLDDEKS